MTKIAYLMIGQSGSGKSTWAKHHCHAGGTIVGLDIWRYEFYRYIKGTPTSYKQVWEFCNKHSKLFDDHVSLRWNDSIRYTDFIIIDNTNMTYKSRRQWVSDLKKEGFSVTAVVMECPVEMSIEVQMTRGDKSVPEEAVRRQYESYEPPTREEGFDSIFMISRGWANWVDVKDLYVSK